MNEVKMKRNVDDLYRPVEGENDVLLTRTMDYHYLSEVDDDPNYDTDESGVTKKLLEQEKQRWENRTQEKRQTFYPMLKKRNKRFEQQGGYLTTKDMKDWTTLLNKYINVHGNQPGINMYFALWDYHGKFTSRIDMTKIDQCNIYVVLLVFNLSVLYQDEEKRKHDNIQSNEPHAILVIVNKEKQNTYNTNF